MPMQNFFILTSAQRTTAMGMDDDSNYQIDPRAVDNSSPGVGINLNDNATSYVPAEPVTLTGCYVSPKRMVDDPDCVTYCPDIIPFLLTLPWASLETETIFAPVAP